jgi:hypothetical protein
MDDGDATVEAFLNPECARIRRAWQRVRTDPVKRLSLLSGIHELSARLGGTIQQMRDAISLRDYNFAWDIFLNFCGDQEYWRSGARQMYGPSVDLTSPFAGYMVCATEILDNVSTTDTSPEGILTVCADSDELRRCEKALALLEQSYTRVRSVPERRQLLSV